MKMNIVSWIADTILFIGIFTAISWYIWSLLNECGLL